MRILIIGGTGFIGKHLTRQLLNEGHEVTIFHRGQTVSDSSAAAEIIGPRKKLASFRNDLAKACPEVVVDLVPMCEADAQVLINTFRGVSRRVVVISSADVYRNYELVRGIAVDQANPYPLTENSPLRTNHFPYRAQAVDENDGLYHYEKILVERVATSQPDLLATILRLPVVYGPGDHKHRLFPYLKRMDDGRPAILLERGQLDWHWTRGYVENVAAAISWAAVGDESETSSIYNVGEKSGLSERDWIASIAAEVGWRGQIIGVDPGRLPAHMRSGLAWEHQLETDTSLIRSQKGFSEPVSFEAGLARTIEWERANPPTDIESQDFDYNSENEVLAALAN